MYLAGELSLSFKNTFLLKIGYSFKFTFLKKDKSVIF